MIYPKSGVKNVGLVTNNSEVSNAEIAAALHFSIKTDDKH